MAQNLFKIRDGVSLPGVTSDIPVDTGGVFYNTSIPALRIKTSTGYATIGGATTAFVASTIIANAINNEIEFSESVETQINFVDAINKTLSTDVWLSTGNLLADGYGSGGCGTQNYALKTNNGSNGTACEIYNGSTWLATGSSGTGVFAPMVAGIVPAALKAGGLTGGTNATGIATAEKFNGATWSATGTMSSAHNKAGCFGVQVAALIAGGINTSSTFLSSCEVFNGTTWSATGSLLATRAGAGKGGAGTQSAALISGSTAPSASTEKFNGSAWVSSTSMNTARPDHGCPGTQNACMAFAGEVGSGTNTAEKFNGLSWANTNSLISARYNMSVAGNSNLALAAGGALGGVGALSTTEKFFGVLPLDLKVVFKSANQYQELSNPLTVDVSEPGTLLVNYQPSQSPSFDLADVNGIIALGRDRDPGDGAWSTTGALSVAAGGMMGAGTLGSGLVAGGQTTASQTTASQYYNGSVWVTGSDLNSATYMHSLFGMKFSAIIAGGDGPVSNNPRSEKFDGTSWSNSANLVTGKRRLTGAGITNSGITYGGFTTSNPGLTSVEAYNGSVWSNSGSLVAARYFLSGCGIKSSALAVGGTNGSIMASVEMYNGNSFATVASLGGIRNESVSSGTTSNAYTYGGNTDGGTPINTSEKYNGVFWRFGPNMSNSRTRPGGFGIAGGMSLYAGGDSGGGTFSTASEKFTSQMPDPFV